MFKLSQHIPIPLSFLLLIQLLLVFHLLLGASLQALITDVVAVSLISILIRLRIQEVVVLLFFRLFPLS